MQTKSLKRPRGSKWRKLWGLAPGTVFLNHGSFGACPKRVLDLQTELREKMEAEPVQFLWRRYEERLEPSRQALARFVHARPRDVVFVTNATTGVNAVLRSMRLKVGDELLTTNQDYNACHNVLAEAARAGGAKLLTAQVPFPIQSSEQVVEAIVSCVTKRTRLAMIDHVTSNTALVFPIEKIVRALAERNVDTLIDGAHAPGMLPLNLNKLAPAYYTGNLHKWVCAPKGAAFFWAREDKQTGLQPAVISHGNNTPRPKYTAFQDRFDWAGTFDPTAWMCVGAALEFMEALVPGGWPALQKMNRELATQARRLLCSALDVEPPCPENMLGSLATIPLPAWFQGIAKTTKLDPEQTQLYDQFGIEVPFVRIGSPDRRYFRVSAQVYNTEDDFKYLAAAIKSI